MLKNSPASWFYVVVWPISQPIIAYNSHVSPLCCHVDSRRCGAAHPRTAHHRDSRFSAQQFGGPAEVEVTSWEAEPCKRLHTSWAPQSWLLSHLTSVISTITSYHNQSLPYLSTHLGATHQQYCSWWCGWIMGAGGESRSCSPLNDGKWTIKTISNNLLLVYS